MRQSQRVFDWARESVDKASNDVGVPSRTNVQLDDERLVPPAADEPDAEIARSSTCCEGMACADEQFGQDGTDLLDPSVRKNVAGPHATADAYEPTHPWHYLSAGDGAAPVPVSEIPRDERAGRYIEAELSKNPKKRLMRMRDLLDQDRERLAADKQRYLDVIHRGVDALSRYDREIAYSNAEIAVASTLALKYRHISLGLGRIAWLEERVVTAAGDKPLGG